MILVSPFNIVGQKTIQQGQDNLKKGSLRDCPRKMNEGTEMPDKHVWLVWEKVFLQLLWKKSEKQQQRKGNSKQSMQE